MIIKNSRFFGVRCKSFPIVKVYERADFRAPTGWNSPTDGYSPDEKRMIALRRAAKKLFSEDFGFSEQFF